MSYEKVKKGYEDNKEILTLINELDKGNSVVCMGKAGCGKSYLIDKLRQNIKDVVVCAPTGLSALNVKGQTLHSFFGLESRPYYALDSGISGFKEDDKVAKKCSLIIIDEISMVRVDVLNAIDQKLRLTMQNNKPFGGKQVLLIGDIFQLPPVVTKYEKSFISSEYTTPYFFSISSVAQLPLIQLTKNYRQKNDKFVKLLDNIRFNKVGSLEMQVINKLHGNNNDGIVLCSTNKKVNEINNLKYSKLIGKEIRYKAISSGIFLEDKHPKPTDEYIDLKVGTRVMTMVNDEEGLYCNGSMGLVFAIDKEKVKVRLDNGNDVIILPYDFTEVKYTFNDKLSKVATSTIGKFTQLPIKKAWAITIHKSQGLTFDKISIDMGRGAFCTGQTYVALSRCKSYNGISLHNPIRAKDIFTDKRVIEYINNKNRKAK